MNKRTAVTYIYNAEFRRIGDVIDPKEPVQGMVKYTFDSGEYFYCYRDFKDFEQMRDFYIHGKKIGMIKLHRRAPQTNNKSASLIGLKESKMFVEQFDDKYIVDMLNSIEAITKEQPELAV